MSRKLHTWAQVIRERKPEARGLRHRGLRGSSWSQIPPSPAPAVSVLTAGDPGFEMERNKEPGFTVTRCVTTGAWLMSLVLGRGSRWADLYRECTVFASARTGPGFPSARRVLNYGCKHLPRPRQSHQSLRYKWEVTFPSGHE